jgi:hypothetical protein
VVFAASTSAASASAKQKKAVEEAEVDFFEKARAL